jgi:hypothetical protein
LPLPLDPRFAGSNPAEDDGFLKAIKIRSPTSFGGEIKPAVPRRKGLRHVKEPFSVALMMEAVRTSETSVNFNVTTRRYIPEDSELHTCRRENLKSHVRDTYRQNSRTFLAKVLLASLLGVCWLLQESCGW